MKAPPEAVAVGEACVELFPQSADAWWLSQTELDAGQRDPAVTSLRHALTLNPNSRPAKFLLRRLGVTP
jgi:hypothetical protein